MKELSIPIVNIIPTMRCNLRCKLCSTQAPYYSKPYHPSLDTLKKQADRLFTVIQSAKRLLVSGGEAMLRPDLPEWINYLAQYAPQIGRMELNTNGTIMPSDELLAAFADYPGSNRVMIDNYGIEKSKKIDEVVKAFGSLKNTAIEYRDQYVGNAYFGGWLDYGVFDLAKIKRKTHEEAIKSWNTCSSRRCNYFLVIQRGILHHCGRHIWFCTNGIIPFDSDETVNLFDTSKSDDEQRAAIASLYERTAFSSCEYCNGFQEDSTRYPPAEQLTREEQKEIWRKNDEFVKRQF